MLLAQSLPKPLVVANWKMHGSVELCQEYSIKLNAYPGMDVWVAPPSLYIHRLIDSVSPSIKVGVQNLHWEQSGAFTGELAAGMLVELGASFAIIGHSERRTMFGETDQYVAQKCAACIDSGVTPIVCVGESMAQRESGNAEKAVSEQVKSVLRTCDSKMLEQIVFAYEPIWAIGTGAVAKPSDAEDMHNHIRSMILESTEWDAEQIRILYGGSVKVENAASLVAQQNVDGFLVGGASLEVDSFKSICQIVAGM